MKTGKGKSWLKWLVAPRTGHAAAGWLRWKHDARIDVGLRAFVFLVIVWGAVVEVIHSWLKWLAAPRTGHAAAGWLRWKHDACIGVALRAFVFLVIVWGAVVEVIQAWEH